MLVISAIWVARDRTTRRYHDGVVGLEGNDLIREQRLVDNLVQLLGLCEVLIIDVTRASRVNSNEVTLARVLDQCVAEHFSDSCVQRCDFLNGNLLLLITDPVLWVAPTAAILVIADDAVFGWGSGVRVVLA